MSVQDTTRIQKSVHTLQFASATSSDSACCELFGANTQGAGFSQSVRGELQGLHQPDTPLENFAADFIRLADNASPSLTSCFSNGQHLFDSGNLMLSGLNPADQMNKVTDIFLKILKSKRVPMALGGDHLLKFAGIRACHQHDPLCGFLYVDAHPDTLPQQEVTYASILHHAVHTLQIDPARILILGLRQQTEQEYQGLKNSGIAYITARSFQENVLAESENLALHHFVGCKNLYVSIDLDAFHTSEAPAVEASFPGGIFFNRFVSFLEKISFDLKFLGFDLTEFMPNYDAHQVTALLAANLAKEFSGMAARQRSQ
jgi:agmatinase